MRWLALIAQRLACPLSMIHEMAPIRLDSHCLPSWRGDDYSGVLLFPVHKRCLRLSQLVDTLPIDSFPPPTKASRTPRASPPPMVSMMILIGFTDSYNIDDDFNRHIIAQTVYRCHQISSGNNLRKVSTRLSAGQQRIHPST